jgi:hypothetical protein
MDLSPAIRLPVQVAAARAGCAVRCRSVSPIGLRSVRAGVARNAESGAETI